jgi:hypothetical protein
MDPRVTKMLEDMSRGGGGMASIPMAQPPQMPQMPQQEMTHPAMLPGVLQVEVFCETRERSEEFANEVNAFLVDLPGNAAIVDRQFLVEGEDMTLLLVLKIPT